MSLAAVGATREESEVTAVLIDSIHRLAAEQIRALTVDHDKRIPRPLVQALAELGLFGMSLPESHGGAGLSLHAVGSVLGALARHDRSVATLVGLHAGLGTRGLVAFGSADLKDRYLPDLATGARVAAFSATEAEAGSDLGNLRTTAVATQDGLRIDGGKVYVTNAHLADVFTLLVSSPGLGGARRGQSLVLLERGDAGLTVGKEEDKLGLRGSSTASLFLDGVAVPASRVIGEPGRGKDLVEHVLAFGRIAMAAGCVGAAEAALELTRLQVTTRRQFGRPLIAFDVVAEQLGGMMALHYGMESLVRRAADAVDERDVTALMARSLAAKVFASEGDWEIVDTALQLHGGGGFIEEGGVPLLLRDARVTRIFEGANDVLLTRLGTLEVSRSDAPRPALGHAAADTVHHWLRDEVDALKQSAGVRVFGMQRDLHRLGRLCVLREVLDAAALRAREAATPEEPRLAHLAQLALRRAAACRAPCMPFTSVERMRSQVLEETAR